jgi:hypothetical protein
MREVDEVAPVVTLQEGAELGSQDFFLRESRDVSGAREPWICHREGNHARRIVGGGLVGVDFHL